MEVHEPCRDARAFPRLMKFLFWSCPTKLVVILLTNDGLSLTSPIRPFCKDLFYSGNLSTTITPLSLGCVLTGERQRNPPEDARKTMIPTLLSGCKGVLAQT